MEQAVNKENYSVFCDYFVEDYMGKRMIHSIPLYLKLIYLRGAKWHEQM